MMITPSSSLGLTIIAVFWFVSEVKARQRNIALIYVYGHTMVNAPVLVWSLKLSNIGPS